MQEASHSLELLHVGYKLRIQQLEQEVVDAGRADVVVSKVKSALAGNQTKILGSRGGVSIFLSFGISDCPHN